MKPDIDKIIENIKNQDDGTRREALIRRAQVLTSLKNSAAFDEFLITIAEDLEGFEVTRDNAKEFGDILESRALAVYAKELLRRIDKYLADAKEIAASLEEDKKTDERPGHPVY